MTRFKLHLLFPALVLSLGTLPADAKTPRSSSAKTAFKKMQPCPATGSSKGSCPGYVIDHVVPLDCGGADAPENMQWQTVADAKEKDRWERKGCRRP
jgi:5-methylcytosine-specific restriction endonuclease McrA